MHLVFLTPNPDPAGGGSGFNAGLVPALRALGHTISVQHDGRVLPEGAVPVVDGLVLPDLEAELDGLVARDAVVIVHHVSAKAGRDAAMREAVRDVERRMLPRLRRVVATSVPVAERLVEEFGIAAPVLLQPGLAELPRSTGSEMCHIVSIGVMTPRKGHDRLLRALSRLTDLEWRLTIAGDAQRDAVHAASVRALVDELGLQTRVAVMADPDEADLEPVWRSADLFALFSSWEGYPAGVAEALRRGLPVVAATVGGVGAMVPMEAGILCGPDDPVTFGKCLRRGIFDSTLRQALADAAWAAGQALPGWDAQARAFETILRS